NTLSLHDALPISMIDELGADSLRFTLAAMAAQGRDIKLSKARVEGYRNFGTKLWNAARFCQMNECTLLSPFDPAEVKSPLNKWILGEITRTAAAITKELEAYRFNEAAGAIYKFVWNVFCDWYLELIKPMLNGADEDLKTETRRTAAWALDQALILLHPFMPFITEELWARLAEYSAPRDGLLITHPWPSYPATLQDPAADAEVEWVINLISEARSVRAELNIPPSAKMPMLLIGASLESSQRLERYQDLIDRLARLEYSTTAYAAPEGAVTLVLGEATAAMQVTGLVDVAAETARLKKELGKLDGEISKIDAKLGNAQFVAKAPEEVIEEQKERRDEAQAAKAKLEAALTRVASLK
ncbi:MAG: class I tRNA ligase family protein, partial [Caulobacterales bacterium]